MVWGGLQKLVIDEAVSKTGMVVLLCFHMCFDPLSRSSREFSASLGPCNMAVDHEIEYS